MKIVPKNSNQRIEWENQLKQADYVYEIKGGVFNVSEEAARFLGIDVEKLKRRQSINKKIFIGAGILFFVIFGIPAMFGAFNTPEPVQIPVEQMTDAQLKEHRLAEFGTKGDWIWEYAQHVKREYVTNPETFVVTGANVFPIGTDSLTHVMEFQAKNALGVKKNHSITSVIDSKGNLLRVVNVQ